ncbi:hypothetical protein LCGC14_2417440 [marine sediment metagenome]|uniref:Uncharacterized protein n=1 Tax=marine sediment metagenome TaxID=412755 RepID=A0A0F9CCX4_9ZZZZ
MKSKPGWKTTEFWMASASALLGWVLASGFLESTETEWDNKIVGLALTGLTALGYGAIRAYTKVGEVKNGIVANLTSLPPS